MTRHDDRVTLCQMRDHAVEAVALCDGKSLGDLLMDRRMALALAHALQILGEAATRISGPFRERHRELPWEEMIGIRNRLVHAYDKIDLAVLWGIVESDLPALIAALERILKEERT